MNFRAALPQVTVIARGILALIFIGGVAVAEPPPDISFTVLRLRGKNVEGPDVERSYFMAGGKRIAFGVPKDCRFNVDGGGFHLFPSEPGFDGEIHVRRSPFTPEMELAANALKYRDAAAKDMPGGVTQVEVQEPVMNPYPFNGWKSLGFTWTYATSGRQMVRTVSYLNLEVGVQLAVTTLAAAKDGERVNKIARQFIGSWWVMGE